MENDQKNKDISRLLDKIEEDSRLIQKVRKAQMQKDYEKFKNQELQKEKEQEELKLEKRVADKHDQKSKAFFIFSILLCVALYVISLDREGRTTLIEYGIYCFLIFGMYLAKKASKK